MSEVEEYIKSKGLNLRNRNDNIEVYRFAGKIEAEKWWKTDGVQYLYDFPEQHRRIDWIISMLYGAVLDVGCGNGMMTNFTVAQTYVNKDRIIGIDPSGDLLKFAHHWKTQTQFIHAIGENLPLQDGAFDCVVLAEVLEHVLEPDLLIDECKRVLKRMGTIVVTTPLDEEKWLVSAPLPNPLHLRSYTKMEVHGLLSKHGFKTFALESGQIGEPFTYTYHTPEGWKEKLCQTRVTFIYAAGIKI